MEGIKFYPCVYILQSVHFTFGFRSITSVPLKQKSFQIYAAGQ